MYKKKKKNVKFGLGWETAKVEFSSRGRELGGTVTLELG